MLDDPALEALTGAELTAENRADVAERLQFFTASLLLFAGVSLFVATFIIYNTFSVVVAQRTRELGLLRAVGASRRQVVGSVLLEAGIIGVVASAVGVFAGLGVAQTLKSLLAGLGFRLPTIGNVVAARTVVVALLVGVVVTTVSAAIPGRRAAIISPLAALRDREVERTTSTVGRAIAGAAGLAIAAALVTLGALQGGDGLRVLGIGALVGFVALAVLGPAVAGPICQAFGRPLTRLRGVPGRWRRQNAMRNPRRTAATASALMIGVGLVAFVTVFAASVRSAVAASVDTQLTADFAVNGTGFRGVVTADVAERVAATPGVAVSSGLTVTRVLDRRPTRRDRRHRPRRLRAAGRRGCERGIARRPRPRRDRGGEDLGRGPRPGARRHPADHVPAHRRGAAAGRGHLRRSRTSSAPTCCRSTRCGPTSPTRSTSPCS